MKFSAAVVLLCASFAFGQNPNTRGAQEVGGWISGGRGVTGTTANTGVLAAGLRFGWVLTAPRGPGFLRGSFEYAVDGIPTFLVFQQYNAYGAGLNPVVLKWNFDRHGTLAPYIELTGGTLFTSTNVPPGSSPFNFTPGAAVGFRFVRHTWGPAVAFRYMHISNAGLSEPNPGINTVQFTLTVSRFRH